MMKTKLEILQNALKSQQRCLSSLPKISTRGIFAIGVAGFAFVVVANHVLSGERLPLAGLILAGICGGVIAAVILTGIIWLCRKLLRSQIASYQEAIEKLEREE